MIKINKNPKVIRKSFNCKKSLVYENPMSKVNTNKNFKKITNQLLTKKTQESEKIVFIKRLIAL